MCYQVLIKFHRAIEQYQIPIINIYAFLFSYIYIHMTIYKCSLQNFPLWNRKPTNHGIPTSIKFNIWNNTFHSGKNPFDNMSIKKKYTFKIKVTAFTKCDEALIANKSILSLLLFKTPVIKERRNFGKLVHVYLFIQL